MNPLLYRNEAGEIAIRRWKLVGVLVAYVLISLLMSLGISYFSGTPFRPTHAILPIVFATAFLLIGLQTTKRREDGKSAWRFSLASLLAIMTFACVLFAAMGIERRADLERHSMRGRLEKALMDIVGSGKVHFSGSTSLIQVKRPTFDDDDLREIAALSPELEAIGAPLYLLDVSGTKITDQGAAALESVGMLEYCFLDQTGVTDKTVDALTQLPKLKVVSFTSTRVTPERLLQLSKERPELNVEPKAYQKLKSQ